MVNVEKIKTRTEDMETKVEGCTFSEFGPHIQERVDMLIAAAVDAERERCASICEGIAAGYTGAARRLDGQHATHAAGQRDGANECAATIRGA